MSEDQRVSRNSGEPPKSGRAGAQRWADYLDWARGDLAATVLSLPYADQRTSRLPSGWTPLELLSHVLHMEQRWFVWGFSASASPSRGATGARATPGPRRGGTWPTA